MSDNYDYFRSTKGPEDSPIAYLFLYGTLLPGGYNFGILSALLDKRHMTILWDDCVAYDWCVADMDGLPAAYPAQAKDEGACCLKGSVYTVNSYALTILDRFEGNPNFYNRRHATIGNGDDTVGAHIYQGPSLLANNLPVHIAPLKTTNQYSANGRAILVSEWDESARAVQDMPFVNGSINVPKECFPAAPATRAVAPRAVKVAAQHILPE